MGKYENPPIVEAIFTISFRELISKETIEKFKSSTFVLNNYPKNFQNVIIGLELHNSSDVKKSLKEDGYLFNSGKNKILSLKYSRLSFHSLEKYDGWENEIEHLFKAQNELLNLDNNIYINKISTRFVNRIKLPPDFREDQAKYLAVYPQIPPNINSNGPFFLSFNTGKKEMNGTIIEKLECVNQENSLIVDINVDTHVDNSQFAVMFGELRDYKNLLFESLLRLETKCLFDK